MAGSLWRAASAMIRSRWTTEAGLGVRPSSRTGGEPTIDQGAGPCRSKAMARHRIHSLAFKKQVVQEYAAGATLNALAREHDLSRRSTRRFAHGRLPRAACITATAVRGTVSISVCGRRVEHHAAMALVKRSPKMTANCALAMDHSRGGIFHSFSERFKTRNKSFIAASSVGKWPLARTARRSLEFRASIAFVV